MRLRRALALALLGQSHCACGARLFPVRLLGSQPRPIRLSRVVAQRGVGSRAEANKLIRQGRVKVDGAVLRKPAEKVSPDATVDVDGRPLLAVPLLMAYHKPKGVVTTCHDDMGRADLRAALPEGLLDRMHPVGRLDADTSGLLLLSSDGQLTHRLLQPRFEVEREYIAVVDPAPGAPPIGEPLVALLEAGVGTSDGTYPGRVVAYSAEEATVRLIVTEGKHRQVRRMLANAGYPVLELMRTRYGEVELGDLEEGATRQVDSDRARSWFARLVAADSGT